MTLSHEIKLTENIFLKESPYTSTEEIEISKITDNREFKPGFCLCISCNQKSSFAYAKEKAIKAKTIVINTLRLLYAYSWGNNTYEKAVFLEQSKKYYSYSNFYYSYDNGPFQLSESFNINYNDELYQSFWKNFIKYKDNDADLFQLLFSIADSALHNNNYDRSINALFERSFQWLSEALDERTIEMKALKATISLEALLNFKSDKNKEIMKKSGIKSVFAERISRINKSDNAAYKKAEILYNARSKIAHGGRIELPVYLDITKINKAINADEIKTLADFDVIEFTATTILLAIQCYSSFYPEGLNKIRYGQTLPECIDNVT